MKSGLVIQIDSLCDIVCFGVFPVIICYFTGMRKLFGILILIFYCLAGLIRLAYFNVMEERRQQETSDNRKYYQGLPITTIAVILPLVYVSSSWYPQYFVTVLHIVMLLTGVLFITRFRVRKPSNKEIALLIGIVAVAVVYILIYFRWKSCGWNWHSMMGFLKRS